MRSTSIGSNVLTVVCIVVAALTATDASASPKAKQLFDEAIALAKDGQYCRAAEVFEMSYAEVAARGALLGLARAYDHCGRLADALSRYEQLERFALEAGDEARAASARERIEDLTSRVPTLRIRGLRDPDVTVALDGERLSAVALTRRIRVDPGAHTVVFERADGMLERHELRLEEGEHHEVDVPAATSDAHAGPWSRRSMVIAGSSFASVGVVGILIGAVMYTSAGDTYDDIVAGCADGCADDVDEEIAAGATQETIGQVHLAIGIGSAAIGAGLLVYALGFAPEDGPVELGTRGVTVRF